MGQSGWGGRGGDIEACGGVAAGAVIGGAIANSSYYGGYPLLRWGLLWRGLLWWRYAQDYVLRTVTAAIIPALCAALLWMVISDRPARSA